MKSVDEYRSEVMALGEAGRCDEALILLDEAIKLYPDSQALIGDKAWLLRALKRYDEALELHDRLLPEAYELVNRGGLLLDMELYSDALESFSKAIDLNNNKRGICIIGPSYGNTAKEPVILEHYQEPLMADAYTGKGRALHGLGRYDDALELYDCAIALEEVLSETYYNFAYVYFHKGNTLERIGKKDEASIAYDKAMKAFDSVIEKQPNDASIYFEKGEILLEIGRQDEAMKAFRRAKEIDPENFGCTPESDGEVK